MRCPRNRSRNLATLAGKLARACRYSGFARHAGAAGEPYRRRKGRSCANLPIFVLSDGQPKAIAIAINVMGMAKITASNQRA